MFETLDIQVALPSKATCTKKERCSDEVVKHVSIVAVCRVMVVEDIPVIRVELDCLRDEHKS